MRNIFRVSFSYVAALVGAGFASGQEIISFFVKYGKMSFLGLIITAVIIGVFTAVILCECVEEHKICYVEYLEGIMAKPLLKFTEITTLFFGISVLCVMFSGFGECGYMLFGLKPFYGICILCFLCAVVFLAGTDKALDINSVLGVIIVIGIISCCFYIITYREHQAFSNSIKSVSSSMSYCGYNLITAGAILAPMSKRIKNTGEAWLIGIVSAVMVFAMMILMWAILSIYYGKIHLGEMPMLVMAMRQNKSITIIYSILLFLALISTAISSGVSCINIMSAYTGRNVAIAVILLLGVYFSRNGFSFLIDKAYRLCGYMGIFIISYIIFKKVIKKRKKARNREI